MESVVLNTKTIKSTIYTGEGIASSLIQKITADKQVFLLTDSNVCRLYGDFIKKNFAGGVFVFKAGEKSKSLHTLSRALKEMLNCGLNRGSVLAALGGGVCGDMGGLAAALYMRGIEALQIPTTLLSQVDSSVGGKTAVNFGGVKNNIGVFYQPQNVICDQDFLRTLSPREIRCGLGEIIKTAALNSEIFDNVYSNRKTLTDSKVYGSFILSCIKHKRSVVEKDEHEKTGLRKTLNLGHTTAHALEIGYKRKSHGEYVLEGMLFETYIAEKLGLCGGGYAEKLNKIVLSVIKKPAPYPDLQSALKAALHDKKNTAADKIALILPTGAGKTVEVQLSFSQYADLAGEYNNAH